MPPRSGRLQCNAKRRSLAPSGPRRSVSGHDFSRAEKAPRLSWALAPEGTSCGNPPLSRERPLHAANLSKFGQISLICRLRPTRLTAIGSLFPAPIAAFACRKTSLTAGPRQTVRFLSPPCAHSGHTIRALRIIRRRPWPLFHVTFTNPAQRVW